MGATPKINCGKGKSLGKVTPVHVSLKLGKVYVAGKQDAGVELQSLAVHGKKTGGISNCVDLRNRVWECAEAAKRIERVKECKGDTSGEGTLSIYHYCICRTPTESTKHQTKRGCRDDASS